MDFALSEEQSAIFDMAKAFGEEHIAPHAMAWEKTGTIPKDLWPKVAELGEEIGAAVVLADGGKLDAAGLRAYAETHLAKFKIPKHIVFLDEIPKGATGKLQRIGLAQKLGLED